MKCWQLAAFFQYLSRSDPSSYEQSNSLDKTALRLVPMTCDHLSSFALIIQLCSISVTVDADVVGVGHFNTWSKLSKTVVPKVETNR